MKLLGFVFGVRVSKSFYLEDKMGAIIDELLYTKGSAFGPAMFPTVQEGTGAKMLYNQSTGDKLTVTHSDFIFEYAVKKDFDSELKDIDVTGHEEAKVLVFEKNKMWLIKTIQQAN